MTRSVLRGVPADVSYRELQEKMALTDKTIQEKFPKDQPYIYTPSGDAIVFKKVVGFEVPKEL